LVPPEAVAGSMLRFPGRGRASRCAATSWWPACQTVARFARHIPMRCPGAGLTGGSACGFLP